MWKNRKVKIVALVSFICFLWAGALWQWAGYVTRMHDIQVIEENEDRICEVRDIHEAFHYYSCYEPTAVCFVFVSSTGDVAAQCLARDFVSGE